MTKHNLSISERLLMHADVAENGCLEWNLSTRRKGYGQMWVKGKNKSVHCLAYEVWVGPIPEGFDVDHECHNLAAAAGSCDGTEENCRHTLCINPEHLVAKPRGANLSASTLTQSSKNKAKTHCTNGHEFTEENTGHRSNGNRYCRQCERERYHRKKGEQKT